MKTLIVTAALAAALLGTAPAQAGVSTTFYKGTCTEFALNSDQLKCWSGLRFFHETPGRNFVFTTRFLSKDETSWGTAWLEGTTFFSNGDAWTYLINEVTLTTIVDGKKTQTVGKVSGKCVVTVVAEDPTRYIECTIPAAGPSPRLYLKWSGAPIEKEAWEKEFLRDDQSEPAPTPPPAPKSNAMTDRRA